MSNLGGGMSGRTLVVEDDPLVRLQIIDALDALGQPALEAANAKAALDLLEGGATIRHLVTDIGMLGGMDGLTLAGIVLERWPTINVVVASGRGCDEVDLPTGAVFLSKPFGLRALMAALERPSRCEVAVTA